MKREGHPPTSRSPSGPGSSRLPLYEEHADDATPVDCVRHFRRRERKYEVGPAAAVLLREEIARRLPLFEFERGQPYTYITTLYFDTKERDFYRRAERSYDDNVKIRVKEYYYPSTCPVEPDRWYKTSPFCYVEIKQSVGGIVVKKRFGFPKRELPHLLGGQDVWPVLQRFTPSGELQSVGEIYRELSRYLADYTVGLTSVVHYRRSVYQEKEEALRITFDDQLAVFAPPCALNGLYALHESLTPEILGAPIRKSDRVILEIKCPGAYPDWLEKALQNLSARRLSKFTTSVRLLLGTANGSSPEPAPQEKATGSAKPPPEQANRPTPTSESDTEAMTGFFS